MVSPLTFTNSLTALAVLILTVLTVSEYQPSSGMNQAVDFSL